jgi:hypothetical protein
VTKPKADTGIVDDVHIAREPPQPWSWKPPPTTPWDRHIQLARANPGQWVLCSHVKEGGRAHTWKVIQADRRRIKQFLVNHHPLERWTLQAWTVADTWCDRKLSIRFNFVVTPEQHLIERRAARATWERNMAKGEERKRERALQAKMAAEAERAKNRRAGRSAG